MDNQTQIDIICGDHVNCNELTLRPPLLRVLWVIISCCPFARELVTKVSVNVDHFILSLNSFFSILDTLDSLNDILYYCPIYLNVQYQYVNVGLCRYIPRRCIDALK